MRLVAAAVLVAGAVAGAAVAGAVRGGSGRIIDPATPQGPFSSSVFHLRNLWEGPVGNRKYIVYAGGYVDARERVVKGGLIFWSFSLSQEDQGRIASGPTWGRSALRITAAHGHVLTLSSHDGTVVFDVAQRRFVRRCRQDARC